MEKRSFVNAVQFIPFAVIPGNFEIGVNHPDCRDSAKTHNYLRADKLYLCFKHSIAGVLPLFRGRGAGRSAFYNVRYVNFRARGLYRQHVVKQLSGAPT
jgi:hypothetical protein